MTNLTLQQRFKDILENPHLIQFYAKSNCRDCYGRGTRTVSTPNEIGQWQDRKVLCECVKKAVRKEAKELDQENG
jgi:hypothetical protein